MLCPTLLHCLSVFELCYLWIVGALNHLHPLMVLRLCSNQLPVCPHLNLSFQRRFSHPFLHFHHYWSHSFIITSRHISNLLLSIF
jgi:hypothetical protein